MESVAEQCSSMLMRLIMLNLVCMLMLGVCVCEMVLFSVVFVYVAVFDVQMDD